ncbi:MAG: BLUF domain-containing protein [Methylophilaceae bacterium]
MAICQLIYTKRPAAKITADDFAQIALQHQTANNESRVSGLLAFHQDSFMHLLEGDKKTVHALLKKVQRDARYTDVETVLHNENADRIMLTWVVASDFNVHGIHLLLSLDDARSLCAEIEGDIGLAFVEFLGA